MARQVLYRKWRPKTFEEMVGQQHVTRTLRNALRDGRIGHAYLFAGPRGTGKTTAARLLAKAVNCLAETELRPCNECSICVAINEGRLLDLIEIDAASNRGIDEIRDLREKVAFRPTEARYKIYVIDECFQYGELVTLADGSKMPIGQIVEHDLSVEVLSYNEQTGEVEPKPVIRRIKKPPHLPTVCITFDNNRKVVCTINHKFYTPEGLKHAGELDSGQFVYANHERITQQQLAVVAGAALGDGHIALTGSRMRARLSITQGVDQKEYLNYKAYLLGDLTAAVPTYQRSEGTYSTRGTYRLSTLSRPQIAQLHRELYDRGKKRISRSYLDRLTPLSLTLWYLDDGSLVTHSHYYTCKDGTVANYPVPHSVLSTHGFSLEEAYIILQWLSEKWGIDGGVSETAKGPVIWLTKRGTERLHEIIAPYVPPSMAYKLLEAYRGQFDPPTDDGTRMGLAVSIVKEVRRVASPDFVYNIEIADNHNYFVRDILVANCHMLTNEAFNALLKTLEEPPPHVIFVLATTEPHKIPATVLSRCQRFDFHRIPLSSILERLEHIAAAEGLTVEKEALELIARSATGSLRDAESLLDQLGSSGDEKIEVDQVRAMLGVVPAQVVSRLVEHLVSGEVAAGLEVINRSIDEGIDPRQLARQITEHLRALMVLRVGDGQELLDVPDESLEEMRQQASRLSLKQMVRAIKLFNQASLDLRGSLQPQLILELAFVEAALGDSQSEPMLPESPPAAVKTRLPAAGPSSTVPVVPPGPGSPSIGEPAAPEAPEVTSAISESAGQETSVATAGGPVTLEAVRLNWARILAEIRPLNRTAEALLRSCAPVRIEGDNILVIGAEHNFHKERLEEPRCKQVLETVVSQVLGYQCRVRCVIISKEQAANPPSPSQADEASRSQLPAADQQPQKYQDMVNDPLIREAVQRYGAQVVDIQ